jgi:hypothetical protein
MIDYLIPDFIRNARWNEFYVFLTNGDPPLILILLLLNTVFFVIYVMRKTMRNTRLRSATVYFLQSFMVAANAAVIFQKELGWLVMKAHNIL